MDAISCILDRSGTVVDIKLPKKAFQGRGRPRGAPNKPKSTTKDPSKFEYLEKKKEEGSNVISENQKEERKIRQRKVLILPFLDLGDNVEFVVFL